MWETTGTFGGEVLGCTVGEVAVEGRCGGGVVPFGETEVDEDGNVFG